MTVQMIHNGEVELATEAFGNPSDPPVLLIMGAMASMLWWPDAFCKRLADAGRFVIRYDNRDTGLSTTYPAGQPGYAIPDMAGDAMAVLDGRGIASAHLVGMSLGGEIAQHAALRRPDRVRSLTVVSSTPVGISSLPPMTDSYGAHAASGEAVDWADSASVLDFMLRDVRAIAGTAHPHDAEAARRFIARDIARARSFASATNHFMLSGGGEDANAADLSAPLLVVHGTADPIFPLPHGEALAAAVPGAKLLRLEGGGHELHKADWPVILAAVVDHTGRAAAPAISRPPHADQLHGEGDAGGDKRGARAIRAPRA